MNSEIGSCTPKEKLAFFQSYLNRYLNTVYEQSLKVEQIESNETGQEHENECISVDPVDLRRLSEPTEPNSYDYFVYHDSELIRRPQARNEDASSWIIVKNDSDNKSSKDYVEVIGQQNERSTSPDFVDLDDDFNIDKKPFGVEVNLENKSRKL